jgi:hypothetical protein
MTRDEIIEMAKAAGAKFDPRWGIFYNVGTATFERFAAFVAAAERERFNDLLEDYHVILETLEEMQAAVTAEREACAVAAEKQARWIGYNAHAEAIAAAIRARGKK